MKIEVTKQQLQAIISMKDDMEAMIGGSEDDIYWEKYILLVNRMLKKNKINNKHKTKQHEQGRKNDNIK